MSAVTGYKLGSASVYSGGSAFGIGDTLVVSLGSGQYADPSNPQPAKLVVLSVMGTTVTSVAVADPGAYAVTPPNPVAVTGGHGTAASFTVVWSAISSIQISKVQPDFNGLVVQLQSLLSTKQSWSDVLTSSTGQTLIEFVAAIGAYSQFSIERALQEQSLDTAMLDSSVYSLVRTLGVRMNRRSPAITSVTLTRTGSLTNSYTIPAYTQFSSGSIQLFNRIAITFAAGSATATGYLYEGQVVVKSLSSPGGDFQTYVSPETGFTVSDVDVLVTITRVTTGVTSIVPAVSDSLWHYRSSEAVQDKTLSSGALQLIFGSSVFGTQPAVGDQINLTYALTNGLAGDNTSFTGSAIQCSSLTFVSGVASSALSSGGDPIPSSNYKAIGPQLYAANDRAVAPQDWRAVLSTYPNVTDVLVLGQADLAPTRLDYMNVVRISMVTALAPAQVVGAIVGTTFTVTSVISGAISVGQYVFGTGVAKGTYVQAFGSGAGGTGTYVVNVNQAVPSSTLQVSGFDSVGWSAFEAWLVKKAMFSMRVYREDPIPNPISIVANIFCIPGADLNAIQNTVANNLTLALSPKLGIIGRNIFISDLMSTIKGSSSSIDYSVITSPTTDVYCETSAPAVEVVPTNALGWLSATAYALNAFVTPSVPNGHIYKLVSAGAGGALSGSVEPTWPTTSGATVVDNIGVHQIVWQEYGLTSAVGTLPAVHATFVGSISGTVLTVTSVTVGAMAVNQIIYGTGVASGTRIVSLGTGTGGAGTYNLNISQTVLSSTMTTSGGSYQYGVSAVGPLGETLPTWVSVVNNTTCGFRFVTVLPPNATQIKIYGRISGLIGLLATLSSPVFTDDGSVIPGVAAPDLDTTGVHYPTLGSLVLNVAYSTRA